MDALNAQSLFLGDSASLLGLERQTGRVRDDRSALPRRQVPSAAWIGYILA